MITITLSAAVKALLAIVLGALSYYTFYYLPKKIAELEKENRWLEAERKEHSDRILKLEHPKEVKK